VVRILEKKGHTNCSGARPPAGQPKAFRGHRKRSEDNHRCLSFILKRAASKGTKIIPLDADLVVIDEASMVDILLMIIY